MGKHRSRAASAPTHFQLTSRAERLARSIVNVEGHIVALKMDFASPDPVPWKFQDLL